MRQNNNKSKEQAIQEANQYLIEFQTINNIWNYWETFIGAIACVIGALLLVNDHSVFGCITCIGGLIFYLFAEIRKSSHLVLFHTEVMWKAILGQNEAIIVMDTTLRTLDLYKQADDKIESEESK